MLLLALAAAAQLSPPERLHYENWFSSEDMPLRVQMAGVNRMVIVRVTVRPDGGLEKCEVEAESGDDALDAFTCSLIKKRARYEAAHWTDGTPVYGVDRLPVRWAFEIPKSIEGDLVLTVSQLPTGVKSPAFVASP